MENEQRNVENEKLRAESSKMPAASPLLTSRSLFSFLHWITALYAVFLTLLLWLPDPRAVLFGWEPGEGPEGFAHLITFSVLGFLAEIGRRKYSFFFWATMLFGYTLLTEIVQEILPIRSFDLFDIMQDLAGLYLGLWAAACVKKLAINN